VKLDRSVVPPDAAPKLVVMKQLDLSKQLQGQFKLVSVEKLMRMLTASDQAVEITVKPQRDADYLYSGSLNRRTRRGHEYHSNRGGIRA
jgi:hypothetical protein